jgi:hypothetical protein
MFVQSIFVLSVLVFLVRSRPFRSRPFQSILVHSSPFSSILVYSRPFGLQQYERKYCCLFAMQLKSRQSLKAGHLKIEGSQILFKFI